MLNRRTTYIWLVCIIAFGMHGASLSAQSAHTHKRAGDLMYDQGEFQAAEESYRKANAKERSAEADYNLGNSIYRQDRYDEAVKHYEAAANGSTDPMVRAHAYHNLGNTHLQAQALDKSVQAYVNALKLNPEDLETKKNLTFALQKLKEQQQQQQQQQSEEEQDQEQQEQEQQQQQQQQQSPQNDEQDSEEQPQPQETQDLSKEEAEELLRIIDAEDQKVQEKLRKATANPRKPKKRLVNVLKVCIR